MAQSRYLAGYMSLLRTILKLFLYAIAGLLLVIIIFAAVSVRPIDRTRVQESAEYSQTLTDLANTSVLPSRGSGFLIGYSKINFTPSFPTATAGYGKRRGREFTSVHDSIYVRTLVITNGEQKVAIVSADLLIIPPTVTEKLDSRLMEIGFSLDNTYLAATHTHNSIGNWGEGVSSLLYGAYDDKVVELITETIVKSITVASSDMLPSQVFHGKIAVPDAVKNRLIDNGPEDPFLRFVEIQRSDSSQLLLMNYTAHATCLFSSDLSLSRDYPGALVDVMEKKFDFAMFIAGAVGSHACSPPEYGEKCITWMADEISQTFHHEKKLTKVTDSTIAMVRIPLDLPDPQVKITGQLAVRSWVFRQAFGEYPVYLTALRLGDIIMLGTPCDYSGELYSVPESAAADESKHVMISSFNGGYIGYLTPEKYYDVNHYETRLMNWYPPGTGEYVAECLQKLVEKLSEEK